MYRPLIWVVRILYNYSNYAFNFFLALFIYLDLFCSKLVRLPLAPASSGNCLQIYPDCLHLILTGSESIFLKEFKIFISKKKWWGFIFCHRLVTVLFNPWNIFSCEIRNYFLHRSTDETTIFYVSSIQEYCIPEYRFYPDPLLLRNTMNLRVQYILQLPQGPRRNIPGLGFQSPPPILHINLFFSFLRCQSRIPTF